MSLPRLPTELQLNIIELLGPTPTLHLALSSKAYLKLCKGRLKKHARLFEESTVVQPGHDGYLIWDVTKDILEDPSKGWYVRELNLVSDRPQERPAGDIPYEDRRLFRAAVEKLEHLYSLKPDFFPTERCDSRQWADMMVEDINKGLEEPILVLLVHHLPWLHKFRMTDNCMSNTFLTFMRRVVTGYQNPAVAALMPLQHLRCAAIAHYDSESHCSVDWAVYFVCIPSLKTFTAFMMGSEAVRQYGENQEAHLRNPVSGPISHVEEIVFNGCQFDPESFDTLLPLVKNLKRFEYDGGGHIIARQDFEPRKVLRALASHAGHSLEDLNLQEGAIDFEVCVRVNAIPDWPFMFLGLQRGRYSLSGSQRFQKAEGSTLPSRVALVQAEQYAGRC